MSKPESGLKSLAQGRSDIHQIDPRKLHIKENWNSRDMNAAENVEHIDMLAKSIAAIGVQEPLTAYWEKDKAYVTNGHCRLLAAIRAIEVYKAELKTVPVKSEDRYANEADRIFTQISRNSGKPFSSLEQAKVYKKLLDLGWQQGDIAKRAGLSAGRVSQILDLLTMPEAVKAMVAAGNVTATLAMNTVKAEGGTEAEKALKNGFAKAQAEGKTKVRPSHVAGEAPKANIRTAVIDAFEYADIDDSAEDIVVVKFPIDKWDVLKDILKL